eukprot:5296667-Pyramimonas_sp.AAC.1
MDPFWHCECSAEEVKECLGKLRCHLLVVHGALSHLVRRFSLVGPSCTLYWLSMWRLDCVITETIMLTLLLGLQRLALPY